MNITDFDGFDQLCHICGITNDYYDIRGVHHVASLEAKLSLLDAMFLPTRSDADIHAHLEKFNLRDWKTVVAPVQVYQQTDTTKQIRLTLNASQTGQPIRWQITEENGLLHNGVWVFEAENAINQLDLEATHLMQFDAQLPPVSEIGYHRLGLKLIDGSSVSSLLIVTPDSCYQPEAFETGKKIWGISLQLYSLRSKRNWGIGDFTDLRNAIKILAPLGVDIIGLNPLHALFSHLPENASPYSPSSRNFLNPVYLDIEAMEEFSRNQKAQQLVRSHDFQDRLQQLRRTDLVDYSGVWAAKLEVLELLYQQFQQDLSGDETEANKKFRQYQEDGGTDLFKFSLFEALQNFFYQQNASLETWQQWPEEFRNPDSNSVANWIDSNGAKIEFHQYLQWQAEQQLLAVREDCIQQEMIVGIYNDLAVGNERSSSLCWSEQSHFAKHTGIGAPPDDFNLLGQNWGLPPQIPQALSDSAYRLFIETLQANMRYAGALRIDHVMGLMRLYWVPENYQADQGTYVGYPFEDLLGILVLESRRNRCLIVGEDLGTVPDEVRHQLWLKKILSYRILFFEKDWHHGTFKPPAEYPPYALCTSGSHDLPTLRGYWQESDMELRANLNLWPSDDIKYQQRLARSQDRYQIKLALNKENLIDDEAIHDASTSELAAELFLSIQRFLARSESLLMMVQLEDMLSQTNQINLPGTIDEYPNWRHKISIDLEEWISQSELEDISLAISQERRI